MFDWIDVLNTFKQQREAVALVTVTQILGSAPCVVGSRMVVKRDGTLFGTIGGGKLEFLAIDEALKAITTNKLLEISYTLGPEFEQCCGGKVEILIEPMNQAPQLFVFGAGHIGVEIATLVQNTPFQVTLIDSREGWLDNLNLDKSIGKTTLDLTDFKIVKDAVQWGEHCYILVLTHDHTLDFELIAMALKNQTKYLGLIGSKTKRARFNKMLIDEMGIEEGMQNVVCPIGLPIGGDTPKEIAISVIAQLLQVNYGENAKH